MSDEVRPIPKEEAATEEVETPKTEEPTSSAFKVVSNVVLPSTGKEITLHKLKAGKHYEAQKLYVQWIEELTKIFDSNNINIKESVDEDGVVDETKLKEQVKNAEDSNKSVSDALETASKAADLRTELLAICVEMEVKELEEEYYPEDLEVLLAAVIELNNFLGNVKKSAAPSVGGLKKKVT